MTAVTITREQWKHRQPDGTLVVIQAGERCPELGCDNYSPHTHPQPWMVEVAQACQNCDGQVCMACRLRDWWADGPEGHECARHVCPDCHDGKPIVTIQVPCDQQCDVYPCRRTDTDCFGGLRTVATATVAWGPLEVVRDMEDVGSAYWGPACIEINPDTGYARRWPEWDGALDWDDGVGITLPPDVDPASLVGQWVLALQIVEGT